MAVLGSVAAVLVAVDWMVVKVQVTVELGVVEEGCWVCSMWAHRGKFLLHPGLEPNAWVRQANDVDPDPGTACQAGKAHPGQNGKLRCCGQTRRD